MADPATDRFVAQLPGLLRELERRAQDLFDLTLTPTPPRVTTGKYSRGGPAAARIAASASTWPQP
jgi:hypothetical protein